MDVLLVYLVTLTAVSVATDLDDDNVLMVNVERFDGDMDICREGEVCADVFNFTRDHGDGTGRLESRFIQNCKCPPGTLPCGQTGTQLMFKETKTQSMVTCESAEDFDYCQGDEIAKEQHNLGYYVYYKINCLCPNNDNPRDFRNKMTTVKRWNEMSPEEREVAERNPRSRFFKCRDTTSRGHGLF
ncbi:uncharacterized protein LOC132756162 isoform X2 [Ruditapes philippinarum]|uniref:uncharacterized protein LOC132756162 isoform X2 n=1 Tax=Ruditapes philippinarum TaxID=129788 RepID=UPI00295BCC21|nr:uncharacterized protein LOC132756162 isoform X2 [Ruditapes philippinarum]